MKKQRLLLILPGAVLALVLTACAPVGPDYHPPDPAMPAGWVQTAADLPAAEREITSWWTRFNDPLLNSLMDRAAQSNKDLRIAEAHVRQARAQRIIAAATGSVNTSVSSTRSRRSFNTTSSGGTDNLFQAGFDAGWELDIFGGVRRAVEAADASVDASREDLRAAMVSLNAEVARNYLELRGNQRRYAVARENIATQQKTVDLVQGRLEMGLGNELDLANARTELAMTQAQIPSLQTSIRQAMYQLAILLGQDPASLIAELSPEGNIPSVPQNLPISMPSDLLRQRPDIRAAERRLAAATAGIGVATADLFPRFSLAALVGLQSVDLSTLVTSGSRYWSVGPTLKLSVFDQGRARAGIEISTAQRDAALALYEKTVLTALSEVEGALTALSHEQETRQSLAEAVASGKKAVTIAGGLYASGLTDFLHVLQSEHALSQSQDQLVQSDQRLALDMVAIFKALGGGWKIENQALSSGATIPAAIQKPSDENYKQ